MDLGFCQVGRGDVNDRSLPSVRENAAVVKLMRRGALLGLLAGVAFAFYRFLAARAPDTGGVTFEASPVPGLPRPVPRIATPATASAPVPAPAAVAPEPAPERPLVDGTGPAPIPEAAFT